MNVLITGVSSGIGEATALKFLSDSNVVYGIDIQPCCNELAVHPNFSFIHCDVRNLHLIEQIKNQLKAIEFDVIVNNAGTIDEDTSISTNLEGYINVAETFAFQPSVKSVVNVGSISGRVGLDTPRYAASQGGRIAYTKNLAIRLGNCNKACVNCVSFGAVLTGLEPKLYAHKELIEAVANENLLKKWISPEEAAQWIYFVGVVNKSMTGEEILIDNGECANYNFIQSR